MADVKTKVKHMTAFPWFGPEDDLGALTDFCVDGGDLELIVFWEAQWGIDWRSAT